MGYLNISPVIKNPPISDPAAFRRTISSPIGNSPTIFTGDVNTLVESGFYRVTSACTNLPVSLDGNIITAAEGDSAVITQYYTSTAGNLYLRTYTAAAWTSWKTSGGVPPPDPITITESFTIPENTSNSDATYLTANSPTKFSFNRTGILLFNSTYTISIPNGGVPGNGYSLGVTSIITGSYSINTNIIMHSDYNQNLQDTAYSSCVYLKDTTCTLSYGRIVNDNHYYNSILTNVTASTIISFIGVGN